MSKNKNLHAAKAAKQDEFYTMLSDIENELRHYREHFKDKIVFCNCDDAEYSNFWRYFNDNFEFLGLKKLIATAYHAENQMYKNEIIRGEDGKVINEMNPNFRNSNEGSYWLPIRTPLEQNGDFRSPESIALLEECDIVVTNPPFSLFREFFDFLIEYKKSFIIMGDQNSIEAKNIFPLIQQQKVWVGYDNMGCKWFRVPDHYEIATEKRRKVENGVQYFSLGKIFWYTNLYIAKRYEDMILHIPYDSNIFKTYDNFNAIDCVVKLPKKDGTFCGVKTIIPKDYEGLMGVAVTFLDKLSLNQFEIVGVDREIIKSVTGKSSRFILGGKSLYPRILIKRR